MKPRINLPAVLLSYLAGFIDADGSIMARIVFVPDHVFKYTIRASITITQKMTRIAFLNKIKQQLGLGKVRDRGDGIAEFSISGRKDILLFLNTMIPFLKLKKKQAILAKKICERLESDRGLTPLQFLKLCEVTDILASLNDSKNRKNTSKSVKKRFIELKFIRFVKKKRQSYSYFRRKLLINLQR